MQDEFSEINADKILAIAQYHRQGFSFERACWWGNVAPSAMREFLIVARCTKDADNVNELFNVPNQ